MRGRGSTGFYFKSEKQLLRAWQSPSPRNMVGEGGNARRSAAHPLHTRGGVGLWLSPGSPPPAATLLAPWLRRGTTSLPLCAEASEEVMSRAATTPQLQAPQPDISAGPRSGLLPLLPSESQWPDSYWRGAPTRLRSRSPTLSPGQSSPACRQAFGFLEAHCRLPNTVDT